MSNQKERILKLVKDGILTNEEAIILLENRANQATNESKVNYTDSDLEPAVSPDEQDKDILDDFYAEWDFEREEEAKDNTGRSQKVAIKKDLESSLASKLTERQTLVNQEDKTESTNIQIDRLTEEINQLTEQIQQLKADIQKIEAENPSVAEADASNYRSTKSNEETDSEDDSHQASGQDYDYRGMVDDFFNRTRSVFNQVQDKVSKTVKFEKGKGSIPFPKLITHDFEAVYDFSEPLSMVDIQIANGQIELTSWDQPNTELIVTGKLYGDFEEEDPQAAFEKRVNLDFVEGALNLNMISRFVKTDIVVKVPKERLDFIKLRTISGPVDVNHIDTNDIYVQTVDGNIDLNDFTASMIEIDTKNGQVNLSEVTTLDLVVKSLNGGQRLKGHVENILMDTLNGDVVITMVDKPLVRAQVSTKNGDIKFNMPHGTAVDGIAQTSHGDIMFRSDFIKSQTQVSEQFNNQKAFYHEVAGEKDYQVKLKALRGNIRVKDDADIISGEE